MTAAEHSRELSKKSYVQERPVFGRQRLYSHSCSFILFMVSGVIPGEPHRFFQRCGEITYGRRKTEKVHGTRNKYHLVEQDNYILVDGQHEAIIAEDVWQAAQVLIKPQVQ